MGGAGIVPVLGGVGNPYVGANRRAFVVAQPRWEQCSCVALFLSFANKIFNGKEDTFGVLHDTELVVICQ